MVIFNKYDLLDKSDEELKEIAQQLNIKVGVNFDQDELIYQIIEEQALRGSANISTEPRKRKRTSAKEKNEAKAAAPTSPEPATEEKPKKGRKKVSENDEKAAEKKVEKVAEPEKEEAKEKKTRKKKENSEEKPTKEAAAPSKEEKKEQATAKRTTRKGKSAEKAVLEQPSLFEQPKDAQENVAPTAKPKQAKSQPKAEQVKKEETVAPIQEKDDVDFIILRDIPEIGNQVDDNVVPFTSASVYNSPNTSRNAEIASSINARNYNEPASEPINAMMGDEKLEKEYQFNDMITAVGLLEIASDNSGYLRSSDYNYLPSPDDVYVSPLIIKQYALCTGDVVEGSVRIPKENEKYFSLIRPEKINGRLPLQVRDRVRFEHLTPLFPDEKFKLCTGRNDNYSVRMVDLFTPIGKGQRALIVAQPKTGKTTLMKDIANAIAANNPNTYLMMLLIDERPEEVTDMARTVKAEVIASTFDEPASNHVKIADLVLEKAKRMVECGHDVVIFLDSFTRLARAYNTVAPASGKVLTGGVDSNALQKPKRFFGAARNIEGGGSLTIIATALIDTGSKMDEVIFEEFKGTGNMELQLDRSLSNKRIFPSINCVASSTRRDDLLQDDLTRDRMWIMRKAIADMKPNESIVRVLELMERTRTNEELLVAINS